jgi:riboflavin biosynthesis protein RibD
MREALSEGRKAHPDCLPNPPVGCVLVRHSEVIARGYTQRPGECHAEAMALLSLSGGSEGVTAYVTLEPCSFHGRTPSCAKSLVESGIRKVVIAMIDPDPRNRGAGVEMLRNAGIEVEVGTLRQEAENDLVDYLWKNPS